MTIFTIGHSSHPQGRLVELLCQHAITVLADVRSSPYSRLHPQFSRNVLEKSLAARGIAYCFLGRELGARTEDLTCYEDGKVQYHRIAQTELFHHGVNEVLAAARQGERVALMCAEKEPLDCHRTILVARQLVVFGVDVQHIHADGKLESHSETMRRLARKLNLPEIDLFRSSEELLAEAYQIQGNRIAYQIAAVRGAAG